MLFNSQMEGTNFSVCIVFSEKDKEVNITSQHNAQSFLYNRFDLKLPEQRCNYLDKLVSTGNIQ